MQIQESAQNLPRPASYDAQVRRAQLLNVLAQRARRHQLRDEHKLAVVEPRVAERNDVRVTHLLENLDLLAELGGLLFRGLE